MINTAEDALAFVSVAKYRRSASAAGPQRAMTLAGMGDMKAYLHEANALTVTFAMIETRTAIDNLDAIAATRASTRCSSARPTCRSR